MKLRGLSAIAFGVAAVSLCSLASAQLSIGDLSGPNLQQVGLDDVTHDRCLSIQFEDVYGVSIETEVTFTSGMERSRCRSRPGHVSCAMFPTS